MSVDLKGNTNFVVLKNLQDELIVPRTNLAAVDMTVANGLEVFGNTISIALSTVGDVVNGTSGHMLSPDVLRSAFTIGQAVDVTSEPDNATNYSKTSTFTTTGNYLGFASFPKYADDLVYLMIAYVSVNSATTINTAGTWLDGTTGAKNIPANEPMKVAMLFSSQTTAKFTFGASVTATVTKMREYEVTKCTLQAVQYIADLYNLDNWSDYYYIKSDMVEPFTYIIPMGDSPEVTVATGLAYSLEAMTGTHTLSVDTCPVGYVGQDTYIRIAMGGNSTIVAKPPLQIADPLTPYAINNCVVQYRDGEAFLHVTDTLTGYVVTTESGSAAGSLPYGLTLISDSPYIAFGAQTDGEVCDLAGVTTRNAEKYVAGNGYTNTTVSGSITCSNKTVFAGMSLQDVVVTGGTLTLGNAYIPSGTSLTLSGGMLAIEKVYGEGTIELNNLYIDNESGATAIIEGVTVTGGAVGGDINGVLNTSNGGFILTRATVTENIGRGINLYGANNAATATLTSCVLSANTVEDALINWTSATMSATDCTLGSLCVAQGATLTLAGSNTVKLINTAGSVHGNLVLASGSILDLTNNTEGEDFLVDGVEVGTIPIAPDASIQFALGGVTVYPSAGSAAAYYLDNITLGSGAHLTNIPVLDLGGGDHIQIGANTTASITGCTVMNGAPTGQGGAFFGSAANSAHITLDKCVVCKNSATANGGFMWLAGTSASATLISCNIFGNTTSLQGGGLVASSGARVEVTSSVLSGNFQGSTPHDIQIGDAATVTISGSTFGRLVFNGTGGSAVLVGNNKLDIITTRNSSQSGYVVISSGASLELTDSIAPRYGIMVTGGTCIVNNNPINPGTYTSINSNGIPTV